jgi:DNA-binding LacI/PurR family transcriptional regulator
VLLMKPLELLSPDTQREVMQMMAQLKSAGHDEVTIVVPAVKRPLRPLAKLVGEAEADAWLVQFGTREVLEWFAASGLPVFGCGGSFIGLKMGGAGSGNYADVMQDAARLVVGLGHRRVVFIGESAFRRPTLTLTVRNLHAELQSVGVEPGPYHVPEWEETPEGLARLLESLFQFTPPTAVICQSLQITIATLGFLSRRGMRVPQDVSVVSLSRRDPLCQWIFPGLEPVCVEEDHKFVLRRIRQWLAKVAAGQVDYRQVSARGRLSEGNSVAIPKSETGLKGKGARA